ncbi:hypothetical protein A4X06_0g7385 [Tilletia controversa]|uniref:alpha-1,2-Mannosidase n=1 Tax=Tilletia controversa TaxID=13291 RepID=A0A8X7SU74_9BASI|nr:hypothetical protein A4X06_0g7385 [Tilletia controversa]
MPSDISYIPLPSHTDARSPGAGFTRTSSRRTPLFTRSRILIGIALLSTLLLAQLFYFRDDILTKHRLAVLQSYSRQASRNSSRRTVHRARRSRNTSSVPSSSPAPPPSSNNPAAPASKPHPDENKGFAPLTAAKHLTQAAFPAAYFGNGHNWDSLYPDGNPHHGVIPARLLSILEKEPSPQRPPAPQKKAPTITPEMWTLHLWDPATHGSKTSFEDNERADMQTVENDWRESPWNTWTPPLSDLRKEAAPKTPLPKVQFPFANPGRYSGNSVDPAAEELAKKRQRLVRNAFLHAWEGYKAKAWGHDEVAPVSGRHNDNFNGWGATPVDVLDTLLVLDLPDEYDYARQHVRDVDFHLVGGTRSAYGSADGQIPVFETAIRYLGGLLSAYDLSGDELMKHRAEELAQLIMPAFETYSGVPLGRVKMLGQAHSHMNSGNPVLAEAGSLLLEFTRLWQVTGNRTYFDRVQRVTDFLDKNITSGRTGALFGVDLSPDHHRTSGIVTFGGRADSYYEYLIKEYQLMGGRLAQYGRMYSDSIESAKKYLMREVSVVPNAPSLFNIGETYGAFSEPSMKLEHLASFAGGMLGLGSKLLPDRAGDLEQAIRYSETCYWAYNSSVTGLGPEDLIFDSNPSGKKKKKKRTTTTKTGMESLAGVKSTSPAAGGELVEERGDEATRGTTVVGTAARALADAVKSIVLTERFPPFPVGVRSSSTTYRNRPETIESVFYMWRITGDPAWRERGWQMFASWVTHSMTDWGFSSLGSVYDVPAYKTDSQESYTFAETFKYYYLLFSPPELISLDHYVFTTEAHPFLVPQNGEYTRPGHGPRKFWTPAPADASASASDPHTPPPTSHLYSGGENGPVGGLTHVQKSYVYSGWKAAHMRRALVDVAERSEREGTPRVLMAALVEASRTDQENAEKAAAAAAASPSATAGAVPGILDVEVLQKVLVHLIEADQVSEELVEEREWEKRGEQREGGEAERLALLTARAEERVDVQRFVGAIRAILEPVVGSAAAAPAPAQAPETVVAGTETGSEEVARSQEDAVLDERAVAVVEEEGVGVEESVPEVTVEIVEDTIGLQHMWDRDHDGGLRRAEEEEGGREVLFGGAEEEEEDVFHDSE